MGIPAEKAVIVTDIGCSELSDHFVTAMQHKGFSMVATLGMCTGRYTKRNKLNIAAIDAMVEEMPPKNGVVEKKMDLSENVNIKYNYL